MPFRTQRPMPLMQKLAQAPGDSSVPPSGPAHALVVGAFLSATPGEWRAIAITEMRTNDLKSTAAGRQLIRQIKVAATAQGAATTPPGAEAGAPFKPQWTPASRIASGMLARRLRALRVAEERATMRRAGAPVPLPTGICRATLVLSSAGGVRKMTRPGCSNTGLQNAFLRAVFARETLRALVGPGPRLVHVNTIAPVSEPGLGPYR